MAFVAFQAAMKGWCAVWRAGSGLSRKALNEVLSEGYHAALLHWHKRIRPKHFTHAGAKEYGYTPRQGENRVRWRGSYTERKLRKWGHTYPLVWSGGSLRKSQTTRIRTSGKGGKASYSIPVFNYKTKNNRVDKRDEYQRISPRDEVEMVDVFRRRVEARLNLVAASQTTLNAGGP